MFPFVENFQMNLFGIHNNISSRFMKVMHLEGLFNGFFQFIARRNGIEDKLAINEHGRHRSNPTKFVNAFFSEQGYGKL
jgi:hypothetical protein